MWKRWLVALVTLAFAPIVRAEPPRELWVYCPTNLLVNENVDKLETLWRRAAAAGYTHVLLADSKFSRLGEMDERYFKNIERVKAIAEADHLQIVPAVFPIGYSNDLLSHDPNLAEGLPVKDALFVVHDGQANIEADPAVKLDRLVFHDDAVKLESDGSASVSPTDGNARMTFSVKVKPYRCYHVSVQIRTRDCTSHPEIKALAGDQSLSFSNLGVKPTQEWTTHHIVFNSLDHDAVNVYLGVWGGGKGELAWRDWKIEEAGLVNLLRRPGAPFIVKDEKTEKMLKEGVDFATVVDPKMGNQPYNGEFDVWHEPPTIKTKGLADGARLRVSWSHAAIIYDGQVACCIEEPKAMELLADQAKRMKAAWGAAGYMMNHDEIRVLNQDASCLEKKTTPGKLLSDNIRACRKLLGTSQAYTWSDMFDPFHNAVKGPYYLVDGDLTGSWEGLDRDVVIMNWNHGKRDDSLKFFADRGHRQIIAGYYDADLKDMREWLDSAKNVRGVVGCMYTTWTNNYDQLEAFAKLCRE